jgi:hypothetical protein
MNVKNLKKVGQLAVTAAAIALGSPQAQAAGVDDLGNQLAASLQGFQILLVTIAVALLGAGIALRFLPTGSHRTKEAAGSLIDNALIMAGLIALGIYLLVFVSRWAITLTGEGQEIPGPAVLGHRVRRLTMASNPHLFFHNNNIMEVLTK